MTWSHARGYAPLVACSAVWRERTGVDVHWDERSLQDFESFPVAELAGRYDLIVIDHPHVGQITDENCLLPLDHPDRAEENSRLAPAAVGRSYESYEWQGRQWALPIDAAAQVQAWRSDLIAEPPADLNAVMRLAKAGRVVCPLRPPHSLMAFFTLAGNLGAPCAVEGPSPLIDHREGLEVYRLLGDLVGAIGPACFDMDPISVLEAMAKTDSAIACAPFIYGYASYAHDAFREAVVNFADIPSAGGSGPVGSALGGTGIAVSTRTVHPEECVALAYWLAGEAAQCGPYAGAGGQPAHTAAWEDSAINAQSHDFYRRTRRTLDGAWVRPRHNGYMRFQQGASAAINHSLRRGTTSVDLIDRLNRMFEESFP